MGLPKLELPTQTVKLEGCGKIITIRPYTVKEQKVLLTSMESVKTFESLPLEQQEKQLQSIRNEIINRIRDLIEVCVVEPKNFKVDSLTLFDLEYLFLQLRIISQGESIKLYVRLNKCPLNEGKPCEQDPIPIEIDLRTVKVKFPEQPKGFNQIHLTENIGITLQYPTFRILQELEATEGHLESQLQILKSCIADIWTKTESFKVSDCDPGELNDFISNLQPKHIKQFKPFLENMPSLEHTVEVSCPNEECLKKEKITIRGITNFFG